MGSPLVRLRTIAVKTPCRVSWDGMAGSDTVRHCGTCTSSVYNLSAMADDELEALLAKAEEVCIRYYSRPDGTLVRTNCSDKAKRAPSAAAAGVAMTLAATTAFVGIDAAVDAPSVATANGEPVLVAMGMGMNLKNLKVYKKRSPKVDRTKYHADWALKQADVSDASMQLGGYAAVVPDASMRLGGSAKITSAPSPVLWRAALYGAIAFLVGLVAFLTRRRWWFGEPR